MVKILRHAYAICNNCLTLTCLQNTPDGPIQPGPTHGLGLPARSPSGSGHPPNSCQSKWVGRRGLPEEDHSRDQDQPGIYGEQARDGFQQQWHCRYSMPLSQTQHSSLDPLWILLGSRFTPAKEIQVGFIGEKAAAKDVFL